MHTPTRFLLAILILATFHLPHLRADEPVWNAKSAAKALDARAQWWLSWPSAARGQGTACISCHTTLSYALARPALGAHLGETEPGSAEKALIDNVKKRVDQWDKIVTETKSKDAFRPYYGGQRRLSSLGAESVVNALVLVNHDVRREKGVLGAVTRKALDHLWDQQQADGAWLWLDFGLRPWETEASYFGASLAAFAVGMAGKDYYEDKSVQPKVDALKKYLATQLPNQRLHHRMVLLWGSPRLPGVLSEQDRAKIVAEILSVQQADGGWSSPSLGDNAAKKGEWKWRGATQTNVVSDGYATGLAVLSLKSARLPTDDAKLRRGIAWLVTQQKDGAWPATYLNKSRDPDTDIGKFMRDAATAFAALALVESK